MKVAVNGEIYDSEETCIVLVFDNDDDRQQHADNLRNMQPNEGIRLYAAYPTGKYTPEEIVKIFNEIDKN